LPDSSVAGSGYYQVDGAYGALFSADLAYQQVDGSVIGRPQLLRDVALQFRRRNRGKRIRFYSSKLETQPPCGLCVD